MFRGQERWLQGSDPLALGIPPSRVHITRMFPSWIRTLTPASTWRRLQCVNMSPWQEQNCPQLPPGASPCDNHISRHAEPLSPRDLQSYRHPYLLRAAGFIPEVMGRAQTSCSVGSSLNWLATATAQCPGECTLSWRLPVGGNSLLPWPA